MFYFASVGCDGERRDDTPTINSSPIVYDSDDRREYYELDDTRKRELFSESMLALVPNSALRGLEPDRVSGRIELETTTLGDAYGLCPSEPFSAQPAAAFCTGILVDWDLVLTAGHCLRLLGLDDFSFVFDYYYSAPDELRLNAEGVFHPQAIVSERLDSEFEERRLDFAWVRLDRPVAAPRRPVALQLGPSRLADGDQLISINSGGGVPLKLDAGAMVLDARAGWSDYFVASTDTSHGSSGAAAFNRDLSLVGVLARGGSDYAPNPSGGCQVSVHERSELATEQFTHLEPAVTALCEESPQRWLCQTRCGLECRSPASEMRLAGNCSSVPGSKIDSAALAALTLLLGVGSYLRRSLSPAPTSG